MAIIQALEYMGDGFNWLMVIDLKRLFDIVYHDRPSMIVMSKLN